MDAVLYLQSELETTQGVGETNQDANVLRQPAEYSWMLDERAASTTKR